MSLTSLTNQYRRDQRTLARDTAGQLAEVFPALDFKNLDASSAGWAIAVESIAARSHRQAVEIGAEFYLDYRREAEVSGQLGIQLADFEGDKLRSSLVSVGPWQAKHLLSAGYRIPAAAATVFTETTGSALRRVLAGARQTVQQTSVLDQYAGGWRRVTGPNPCGFCAMVALNLYDSEGSASRVVGRRGGIRVRNGVVSPQALGKKYHDHCQCYAIPGFRPDAYPDGYVDQLNRFQEIWDDNASGLKSAEQRKVFFALVEAEFGHTAH